MNVRVLHSILEIDAPVWDALCDHPVFSHGWFRALEEGQVADIEPRHLVLEQDGRAVGVVLCFIQRGDPYYTLSDRLFGGLAPALSRCGIRVLPALLAYTPLVHRTELFLKKGFDRARAVRVCSEAMDRICREERLPVSGWLFVSGNDLPLLDALRLSGHAETFLCPAALWTNSSQTFQEYLGKIRRVSLNNYKVARKELNHHARSGIGLAEEPLGTIDSRQLADMRSVFYARHKPGVASPWSPLFFDALKRYLGSHVVAWTARQGQELLRYRLSIKGKNGWHELIDGQSDDMKSRTDRTLFNLAFYFPIRRAIETGAPALHFGLDSYEMKVRRGCQLDPIHIALRFHVWSLRWWLTGWVRLVGWWYRRKHRGLTKYYRLPPPTCWTPADSIWTRAWRAWHELGPTGFACLVGRKLAESFGQRIIIEELSSIDPSRPISLQASDLNPEIRRIEPEELATLRPISSRAMYRRFEQFMRDGYRCYVALVGGQMVAYQWYCETPYHNPAMNITISLLPSELFSVYSFTLRAWRRRGLATEIRSVAFRDFQREGFLGVRGTIDASNLDSLGVFLPLGGRPCRQYRVWRVLGWRRVTVEPLECNSELRSRLSGSRPFREVPLNSGKLEITEDSR